MCCPISGSLEEYQKKSRRDALYAPTLVSLQLSGPKLLKGPQSYFHLPFIPNDPNTPPSLLHVRKKGEKYKHVMFNYSVVYYIVVINVGDQTDRQTEGTV